MTDSTRFNPGDRVQGLRQKGDQSRSWGTVVDVQRRKLLHPKGDTLWVAWDADPEPLVARSYRAADLKRLHPQLEEDVRFVLARAGHPKPRAALAPPPQWGRFLTGDYVLRPGGHPAIVLQRDDEDRTYLVRPLRNHAEREWYDDAELKPVSKDDLTEPVDVPWGWKAP